MVAIAGHVLQCIGDGRCSRGHSQTCHTTLQGSYSLFQYALGRVGEASVDVTCIAKSEAVGCMLRVAEHVRSSLIDRHCAGIGGGVGLLLADVQLQRLKV